MSLCFSAFGSAASACSFNSIVSHEYNMHTNGIFDAVIEDAVHTLHISHAMQYRQWFHTDSIRYKETRMHTLNEYFMVCYTNACFKTKQISEMVAATAQR